MKEIGLSISLPAGSISEGDKQQLNVYPVLSRRIEMPENSVSHSPLYIMTPLEMQRDVKITIEHSCCIETEEDHDTMMFLGVESGTEQDGTFKLTEIPDAVSTFRIGDRKCDIVMRKLQSLRVGRKVPHSNKGIGILPPLKQ